MMDMSMRMELIWTLRKLKSNNVRAGDTVEGYGYDICITMGGLHVL